MVGQRLTVLHVEVSGLRPGTIARQGGGTDPHRVIPRIHNSEIAASIHYVVLSRHAVMQILQENIAVVTHYAESTTMGRLTTGAKEEQLVFISVINNIKKINQMKIKQS